MKLCAEAHGWKKKHELAPETGMIQNAFRNVAKLKSSQTELEQRLWLIVSHCGATLLLHIQGAADSHESKDAQMPTEVKEKQLLPV